MKQAQQLYRAPVGRPFDFEGNTVLFTKRGLDRFDVSFQPPGFGAVVAVDVNAAQAVNFVIEQSAIPARRAR